MNRFATSLALILCALLCAACTRERSPSADDLDAGAIAEVAAPATPTDVPDAAPAEDDPMRITLSPGLDAYPSLAATVRAAAERHRQEMERYAAEIAEMTDLPDSARQWSLEVAYSAPIGTGGLRVVAGEGYVYTGGAHGLPIIERYTYDVERDRVLALSDWFDGDDVWQALSEYARTELTRETDALLAQYGDSDGRSFALKTIEGGTEPVAENFALYEPVFDEDGAVTAVELIFPPYQVASYAEGIKTVQVPNRVFRSWIAAELVPRLAAE